MIKSNLCLIAAVVLFAPACTKSRLALREPADPSGADPIYERANVPDPLPELLKETVLHYSYDDATLSHDDLLALRKLADAMRVQPWASIRIAGHCDERGTEEYNLALGQRRADAARAYMIALGVAANAVETITFGEELPLIEASTEEAFAENRRAEFGAQPLELFGLVAEN